MDTKPNFNNDLCDIICEKDLVAENEILKVNLEEANQENIFLEGEVKDLNSFIKFKPLLIILKHIRKNACYKKTLIHKYNHNLAFKLILPKIIMLYNQNSFSNKTNSFIPQINSDLITPAKSDPDLKSSIHSTDSNYLTKAQ